MIQLLNALATQVLHKRKKLPDLSFYDIEDGFHMEMRMYSLDSIFYKRKASADELVNEITKFILYTENLMMNVIAILNEETNFNYIRGN